jgi:phosphate transport system permease protein
MDFPKKKHLFFDTKADAAFKTTLKICACLFIIIVTGIAGELIIQSWPALKKFGPTFFISDHWDPVLGDFGALSSIYGTLVSTLIAMAIAVPLSLGIAIFLVELAPPKVSRVIGSAIELLAAIPSIIYGMWGLFVFAPFMADSVQPFLFKYLGFLPWFQGPAMGIGMLSSGIILSLMILPFISSVTRDVFKMVPSVMKESSYGMGATLWETTKNVTLRFGLSGILGATFLGLGRALGETMAVTFVIGNDHGISVSLFAAGNSIASTLANEFSEASDPLYVSSLMTLGLTLFAITLLMQVLSQWWISHMQKKMGMS